MGEEAGFGKPLGNRTFQLLHGNQQIQCSIYMAIELDMSAIVGREKSFTLSEKARKRRLRGHPQHLSDDELLLRRDSLYSVFAHDWARVGLQLRRSHTLQDVSTAIRALGITQEGMGHHGIAQFTKLGPVISNAKAADLRRLKLHVTSLVETARLLYQEQREAEEWLQKLGYALQQADKKTRRRFRRDHAEGTRNLASLKRKEARATKLLRRAGDKVTALAAQLACEELLSFIREKRYTFSPLNLANAMAGVPEISYRRSAARCAKLPKDLPESLNYQLFVAIGGLLKRCCEQQRERLLACLKKRILRLPRNSATRTHLCENWYCFKQTVDRTRARSAELPFALVENYLHCCHQGRTAVTEILLERERIRE
jgi:hypothetical protein